MKNKTIIIDSAHREETRVAVLEDGILQDFDREAIAIKQIKGNIYLAKVTRVEPSLQSAFVDYDGNRHGFLPFADIHPDYFQLSESEKQKLRDLTKDQIKTDDDELSQNDRNNSRRDERDRNYPENNERDDNQDEVSESFTVGSYSVEDETGGNYSGNIHNIYRKYNIQDVIKPGQLLLIQVTKEERGNKGASMTTYISLAGKYCVLMSNTPNKGGVSKKVDNFRDRKLLKSTLNELNIPNDRSVIIRTAGVGKKPEEIKRDYDYLSRLWDSIKEAAANSKAPSFIHAEDDVIKRCIRDVYNEQVSEVVVEGKKAFEEVTNFIKLTMSSAINNVKLHEERIPIFNKYRVEQQISSLYEKQIALPSGGSIVIDHSEALVAIDVNSGRATKESGVEETAFNTNLEAVKEIARQLRLRDLAGLVVIDFIDMYDQKHRRNIERALRDELQNDRARIQLGRISVFGLLEMSRQRLGASFFETITEPCKHCNGTGYVRSVEILAVSILRSIRYACTDNQVGVIYIYTTPEVIAYMMNYKKNEMISTEKNYNIHIFMHQSSDVGSQGFTIKKRKSLSDDERRELEMEVVTGKVNQLGLEKSYLDNYNEDHDLKSGRGDFETSHEENFNRNHKKFDHKFKKNRRNNNRKKFDNRPDRHKKASGLGAFFSGIFGGK
ncbi:MAG: Rne/Rng family ribonuclease [Rickettsiales bacterium]|nr:Rne/Rng family ribonuclease [Rickettsiales bacterium]